VQFAAFGGLVGPSHNILSTTYGGHPIMGRHAQGQVQNGYSIAGVAGPAVASPMQPVTLLPAAEIKLNIRVGAKQFLVRG
jgi:hypothetical protein